MRQLAGLLSPESSFRSPTPRISDKAAWTAFPNRAMPFKSILQLSAAGLAYIKMLKRPSRRQSREGLGFCASGSEQRVQLPMF